MGENHLRQEPGRTAVDRISLNIAASCYAHGLADPRRESAKSRPIMASLRDDTHLRF
jgi:hypothetical protein